MDYLSLIKQPIIQEIDDFIALFNTSLSHDDSHTTFGRSLQTRKKRYTLPLQGIAYLPSTHIDRNSVRLKALGAGTGFVPVLLRNYTMRSFIRQL